MICGFTETVTIFGKKNPKKTCLDHLGIPAVGMCCNDVTDPSTIHSYWGQNRNIAIELFISQGNKGWKKICANSSFVKRKKHKTTQLGSW